ncbi:MAG: neutral zinc metallopeptidase [Sphingopyxis sp.]
MRLDEFDPSDNARDLGTSGGGGMGGGGGFGGGGGGLFGILFSLLPMLLGRRMGCGGIVLIAVIGFFVMNSGMLSGVAGDAGSAPSQQQSGSTADAAGARACDTDAEMFACRALKSTEIVWTQIFQAQGERYPAPSLNFFTRQNQSGCGVAQSAMGPFYCPADQGVYLDTDFFDELSGRFGAAGDAAQAYVIAHEVGHHIQKITGVADQVRQAQSRASETQGNALQVRMELQADCYAGVWAAVARTPSGQPVIEQGDVEEAMRAAHAIGDDTLMRGAGQNPVESMFTHGSSEQRMRWLKRGLDSGDYRQCNTFAGGAV